MKKRYTLTLDADVVKAAKIEAIRRETNFSEFVEDILCERLNLEHRLPHCTDGEKHDGK